MMTFRNHRLRDFAVPMSTAWLLNDIAEAKGRQIHFMSAISSVLVRVSAST